MISEHESMPLPADQGCTDYQLGRRHALEEAAKLADTEPELPGEPPDGLFTANLADVVREAVHVTKCNISERIRALIE